MMEGKREISICNPKLRSWFNQLRPVAIIVIENEMSISN